MMTLAIYLSALFLGFLIVVVVALCYAIMASEAKEQDGVTLEKSQN